MGQDPDYRAFLVRFWRSDGAGWRAAIEDPHTGERRGFASVEHLVAFLQQAAARDFAPQPQRIDDGGGSDVS